MADDTERSRDEESPHAPYIENYGMNRSASEDDAGCWLVALLIFLVIGGIAVLLVNLLR